MVHTNTWRLYAPNAYWSACITYVFCIPRGGSGLAPSVTLLEKWKAWLPASSVISLRIQTTARHCVCMSHISFFNFMNIKFCLACHNISSYSRNVAKPSYLCITEIFSGIKFSNMVKVTIIYYNILVVQLLSWKTKSRWQNDGQNCRAVCTKKSGLNASGHSYS